MSTEWFAEEWTMVDQLKPVDLSDIEDSGMQAAVLLAVALGWNMTQRRNAPAQLRSRSGITRSVPSDTAVRQSVFWSTIANILAHSEGRLPTPELMTQIVKRTGLSKAHERVLRSRVEILVERDPKTLEEMEEIEEEPEALNPLDLPIPEGDPPPPFEEFVPTERVEPTLNMANSGAQYISPVMDTVIRRLVEDGDEQITYRCKVCGLEYETKRGCGSHYQRHVQAGEAVATNNQKRTIVNVIPDYEPTEVHVRSAQSFVKDKALVDELMELRGTVATIAMLVGGDMVQELEITRKERDDAIARADRLASDLRSLRELIGGISDE